MYQNIFVKTTTNEAWVWDDKKGLTHFNYTPYAFRKDPKGNYRSIFGDKLSKVTSFVKNDPDLFESDVPETTRLLVDMYGDSDLPSNGIITMAFDIEVEMISGTPDPELGLNEVTSIAYHDSVTSEYTVLVLDKKRRVQSTSVGNRHVISCVNEKDLLLKFLEALEEIKPHILTGWNSDNFDIPYLYNRIKRLLGKKVAHRLSPIGEVYYSPYRNRYSIAGISSLDYMVVYKKFSYSELPSYALNAISMKELGRGKIEYEGNLDDLMENDIQTFIDYNITDVELVLELDKKLKYIDLLRGICHVGHVPYEDFVYSSKYLEGSFLTYLKRAGGIVAPNKPADRREKMAELKEKGEDGFIGAFVKEPVPGKYEWVYDLDLTSLYPSIIMTLNISPETKVAKILDWDGDEFIRGNKEEYIIGGEKVSKDVLKQFLEKHRYTVASNGVMYNTETTGLIPAILNEWFDKRVEYKDEMKKWGKAGDTEKYEFYKKRQLVQKILLNSAYGALGLPAFRFYDLDNAEAVTLSGQTVIKKTQDAINMKYNKELGTDEDHVVYVDTDSVFVSCSPLVKNRFPTIDTNDAKIMTEKIYEIATEVQNYVNGFYDFFARKVFNTDKHRLEIKQEMIARTGFWVKKKRYALWVIADNGVPMDELKVTGLDVVRSSFPKSFQKFMKSVLVDILKSRDIDQIDDDIIAFKKNLNDVLFAEVAKNSSIKDIKKYADPAKDMPLGKFAKGTPAHVKASINYNKMLKLFKCPPKYAPIRNGDKVKIAYLKQNHYGLSELAFRGDSDPEEIITFIKKYFDAKELFTSELDGKLRAFYGALRWEYPSEHKKTAQKFFSF